MSSSPTFASLPGFRDFPPEELAVRSRIFDAWRRVSRRYGFVEYDGPPLESLDLYVEKSGEEIVGQLYAFEDRGGRDVALRPEMTPTLARMLAERSRALPKPIRWFSVPQLFRYERQQRGRLREHFQWNVDIVGEAGPGADAEILAVALDGLRELGLTAELVRARVSDRRLLGALLRAVGVPEDRLLEVFTVVDKLEREPRERLAARLEEEASLDPERIEGVFRLFARSSLDEIREDWRGDPGIAEALEPVEEYLSTLSELGFSDFVEFDLTIVRGLAYYTGIVFEIFDRAGELRAICGGGRYDDLLARVGGEELPASGFGMGDVVLRELLEERGLLPEYRSEVDYALVAIGAEQRPLTLRVARALRAKGASVVYGLRELSVRKQFQAAGSVGAREVVVIGPDEVESGVAVVRAMATGEERTLPLTEVEKGIVGPGPRSGAPAGGSEGGTAEGSREGRGGEVD